MRTSTFLLVAGLLCLAGAARGGEESPPHADFHAAPTLYGFAVRDQTDFLMLVAPADVRWLHLEVRYNYEGIGTGSAFVGWTGHGDRRVKVDATAMVGGVFGDVRGVVPATRLTLRYWKLDLLVEAQYVVDLGDFAASFFYAWSELGFSPLRWLRLAIVGQRTHILHNNLQVQRGAAVGAKLFDTVTLTAYELNLGWISPTFIGAIGVEF
jgi:hypothetical protein